jgi:prephenate dehydratase
MLKIGYLGPAGTFSHEAVKKYAGDKPYTAAEYSSISELLLAVQNNELDEAVVPMENSIEGAVNATIDMMAFEVNLMIKAELIIPVKEHLLAKKGTSLKDVRYVLSHPQPIGQCRRFLTENLPDAKTIPVLSTAAAAKQVSESGFGYAAIGSEAAAEAYDLEILQDNIQDMQDNCTRFIVASHTDSKRTGNDRTSIVFSTDDKPGSLYRILDIFNLWDINMSRIESRPAKSMLGRYIFFVDLIGHRDDEDLKEALIMVKRKTSFYKFLGSYPICS